MAGKSKIYRSQYQAGNWSKAVEPKLPSIDNGKYLQRYFFHRITNDFISMFVRKKKPGKDISQNVRFMLQFEMPIPGHLRKGCMIMCI